MSSTLAQQLAQFASSAPDLPDPEDDIQNGRLSIVCNLPTSFMLLFMYIHVYIYKFIFEVLKVFKPWGCCKRCDAVSQFCLKPSALFISTWDI